MKKHILIIVLLLNIVTLFSQTFSLGTPDSIKNVPYPNSTGSYSITNPLTHNGTNFTNSPMTVSCIMNCKADILYFYDMDLNIPANVNITGVEVIHTRGGCNAGSFMIDTLHLAYNGAVIGTAKRDTASMTETDTLGTSSDLWGAVLTPAIVNSNSFGIFIQSTGSGICTYGHFNVQIKVYYSCTPGQSLGNIPDSVSNIAKPGSSGSYNISNPLTHNGTQFTNPPMTMNCVSNCKSDYLYFQEFGISIPSNATITGIELKHNRGACNGGSYMVDTLQLAYNGAVIGQVKRDTSSTFESDTLGSNSDSWGAVLTPAIVNDPSFGLFIHSTGTGICTYGQYDIQMNVYFCINPLSNLTDTQLEPVIKIYPNPGKNSIYVETPVKFQYSPYIIRDIAGRVITTGNFNSVKTQIYIEHFLPGIYVLQSADGSEFLQRFIVE